MKRILLVFLVPILVLSVSAQKSNYKMLIGTYTTPDKSKGIYSYTIDMNKGVFTEKSVTTGIQNPSFMAVTPDKKFVYSVSESADGSSANAFSLNDKTGYLKIINSSLTKSNGPCNISVTANHVFTANYDGGSISVFGKKADGSLTDVLQVIQHTGKSINTERQNEPHVHQVLVTPDTNYVLANDLGTDKVTVYQYNKNAITNVLIPFDTLNVKPGSGPRHSAFSKDGTKLYLAQEIDGTVSVLGLTNGRLNLIQETTVDYKTGIINRTADIHLSPDENFLYVTNRGTANDITCFSVEKTGKLTFRQQISTAGDGPRNFAITPDGNYVFVANQNTDNIVILKRDKITGFLSNTGKQIKIGAPVCLLFY
jgi:6-phosphogluconolactonase